MSNSFLVFYLNVHLPYSGFGYLNDYFRKLAPFDVFILITKFYIQFIMLETIETATTLYFYSMFIHLAATFLIHYLPFQLSYSVFD